MAYTAGAFQMAATGFGAPTNLLDLAEPAGQGVWEGAACGASTVHSTKGQPCCLGFGRPFRISKLSCAFGATGLKQIDFSQLALLNGRTEQSPASIPPTLAALRLTTRRETTHHLRDGEVVL